MKKYFLFLLIALINISYGEAPKDNTISLFGSKPIQLDVSEKGITQNKEPGFRCDLEASLGGGRFSEWGTTEENARSMVTKKCSTKAGLFLCKKEKAVCKQDK